MDNKLLGLLAIIALIAIAVIGSDGELFAIKPSCAVKNTIVSTSANTALVYDSKSTTLSAGKTLSILPYKPIDAIVGYGDPAKYGDYVKFTTPCKETYTLSGQSWVKDLGAVELKVYDEFDYAQPGVSSAYNQELGVGEIVDLKLKMRSSYKKFYGNPDVPGDNVLVFEYNRKEIKSLSLTDKSGKKMSMTTVPKIHALSSTNNAVVAFKVPKLAGNAFIDYTLRITAGSITNPTSEIEATLYDVDWFVAKPYYGRYSIKSGVEDSNNADIGVTAEPKLTIFID